MQKNILSLIFLIFVLIFLSGCVCPPNDWSGPWPPWCEKGTSWDRPSVSNEVGSTGNNSDSNISGPSTLVPINPVEKIIDIELEYKALKDYCKLTNHEVNDDIITYAYI